MTAPSQDIAGFFSGGGKAVSWADADRKPLVGKTVKGKIVAIHPPEGQTDIRTGEVLKYKDGSPKMQIRIELQTDERDPQNDLDDGVRTLYVKGHLKLAVGDALRKAGAQGPEVGGDLSATLTHTEPSDTPGFNPTNKFSATYEKPSAASTGDFFNGGSSVSAPPAPEPARPPAISEAAWSAMDADTKAKVAKTMGYVPPF